MILNESSSFSIAPKAATLNNLPGYSSAACRSVRRKHMPTFFFFNELLRQFFTGAALGVKIERLKTVLQCCGVRFRVWQYWPLFISTPHAKMQGILVAIFYNFGGVGVGFVLVGTTRRCYFRGAGPIEAQVGHLQRYSSTASNARNCTTGSKQFKQHN